MKLYPLSFTPLFKYRLWGGEKLRTQLHKVYEGTQMGESWEISDVKGSETKVASGPLAGKTLDDLIALFGADFLGQQVMERFGTHFPLLVKFIDAKKSLSIQVHPDDQRAKDHHNSRGKNEMWYIMQSDEDAEIIVGFKEDTDPITYQQAIDKGTVLDLLNVEKTQPGDLFHIPTGRVHAIGGGVVLAEIQQTSDITYRIYDYDRVDAKTGKKRDLHNDQAVEVIDFKGRDSYKTPYCTKDNKSVEVMNTPYFKTNIIAITQNVLCDYSKTDSFVILMCVDGTVQLDWEDVQYELNKGETLLLPAIIKQVTLTSHQARVLEVRV